MTSGSASRTCRMCRSATTRSCVGLALTKPTKSLRLRRFRLFKSVRTARRGTRHQSGPAVKYLDEFGDAELAKRLLDVASPPPPRTGR